MHEIHTFTVMPFFPVLVYDDLCFFYGVPGTDPGIYLLGTVPGIDSSIV